MKAPVIIVDYECMTPLGVTLLDTWQQLANGRSGIRTLDRFDPTTNKLRGVASVPYGGQIPLEYVELAGGEKQLKRWPEPAYHAVRGVSDCLLKRLSFAISDHDPQRVAVIGATAFTSQISQDVLQASGQPNVNFTINQCQTTPVAAVAIDHGVKGPVFNVASACASSGHALYLASQLIQGGIVDCALVCGFEFPLLPICTGGFGWLNAMYKRDSPEDRAYDDPTQASRPFSRGRRGFVLAEGVGAVLLASKHCAESNRWSAKGAIRGGCVNADAGHLTRLSINGVATCIDNAIKASGCSPEDIDVVSAHATSTKVGDAGELQSLASVFGEERLKALPVVATKSQLGHTLGAASILALMLTLEGMRTRTLLPTLNFCPDSHLPSALISETVTRDFDYHVALINSFGFGGLNAVLVVTDHV